MFYPFVVFGLLVGIHANPFPQSSNELINAGQYSTETTFDIASSGLGSDPVPVDRTEGSPSQDSVIAENTIDEADTTSHPIGCTSDASTDIVDGNTVFKRGSTYCPSDVMAPTKITPGGGGSLEIHPLPQKEPPVVAPKKPTSAQDGRCDDHPGRSYHVTCGGVEIGVQTDFIAIVANCIAGSAKIIETRPPGVFVTTEDVAEYCCESFGDENLVYTAAVCTKLSAIRRPHISLQEFMEWVRSLTRRYGPQ